MTSGSISINSLGNYGSVQTSKSAKKLSGGSGFDCLLNIGGNSKSQQNVTSDNRAVTKNVKNTGSEKNVSNDSINADSGKTDENAVVQAKEDVNQKVVTDDSVNDDTASAVVDEIRKVLKDILQIDDDELDDILAQVGITDIMQLDNNCLKEIAVIVTGESDVSALITNENTMAMYTDLCEQLGNIDIDAKDMSLTAKQLQVSQTDEDEKVVGEQVSAVSQEEVPAEGDDEVSMQKDSKDMKTFIQDDTLTEQTDENQKLQIRVETDTNGSQSSSGKEKHGTGSKDTDNMLTSFVNNLENARNVNMESDVMFDGEVAQTEQMHDIVEQIVDRIRIDISDDSTSMEMMLNPEHLGKLNLSITARNGVMTAQFIVENETAKQAIESQIQVLRDNLESQGVKVEAVEVTISNMSDFTRDESSAGGRASDNASEGQKKSRHLNINLEEDKELEEHEQIVADMMRQSGSNVMYTA